MTRTNGKKTRRSPGTGSVNKLPNGTWRALATIEGKRISRTFQLQRQALDWLAETRNQVGRGMTLAGTQTTLDQVLTSWLDVKRNKLRQSTLESYTRMARLHIRPQLGKILLQDLSAARLQSHYGQLQAGGLGARSVEIVHVVLHGCLDFAHRLGLVSQNPAKLVEAPRPVKVEMKIWDESQVSAFLASLQEDQAFYRLAFATGMRRGELIGLQWQDLDWQSGALMVRRQVYHQPGGGWRFVEPKTARGRRTIRIGPGLVEALRLQYMDVLPLMRGFADEGWTENELIFPASNGQPRRGYQVSKKFADLAAAAGLPHIRFHDIRHTAASLMLAAGETPIRVSAILGQSLTTLLETYAHHLKSDDQASAAAYMDSVTTPLPVDLSRTRRARNEA